MKYSYKSWFTVSICFILICCMCFEVYCVYGSSDILEGKLSNQNVDLTAAEEYASAVVDVMDIVFWTEKDKEVVNNFNGSRNSELSIMYKAGKSSLLYPECKELLNTDTSGCLLSTKSAYALFGSREVIGLSVFCGEKEYIIRDIINCEEEMMVLNAAKEDDIIFSHLSSGLRGGTIEEKKIILKNDYGLEVVEWIYNMLCNMIIFELTLTAIIICWKILRKIQSIENTNWSKKVIQISMYALTWIAVTGAGLCFFTILGWPAKWSDFTYWMNTKQEFFVLINFLINSTKNAFVLKRIKKYLILLFAIGAANIALLLHERKKNCDL